MNKVVTINLNGNAYQLEEKAYEALHKYLEQAAKALADNPDKTEIVSDLELAVAEKCDNYLRSSKNVVTSAEVEKILKEMGPVEAGETDEEKSKTIEDDNQTTGAKRLYVIPKGGVILGVCNGLAAYFGVDVNVMRIAFIILTFVTGGFMILVYIFLAFALPYAKTNEQLAEAYGRRVTAQEIVDNAKDRAKDLEPALGSLGRILVKLGRICLLIAAVGTAVLLGLLTTGWLAICWWLAFGHLHLTAQLSTISSWTVAAGITALYLLMALPLFWFSRALQRVANYRESTRYGQTLGQLGFALWFVALAVLIGVFAIVSGRAADYQRTHDYINIDGHNVCINRDICGHRGVYFHKVPDGLVPEPPQPMYTN